MYPSRWFAGAQRNFGLTLNRFGWVIACALAGTVLMEVAVSRESRSTWDMLIGPILACILGLPLLFMLRRLREALALRWPLEIAGVGMLVLYAMLLPPHSRQWPQEVWTQFFLLLSGLTLLALVVPFWGREKEDTFWEFNRRLFVSLFWTGLCTGILVVGLELALVSIRTLFDVRFSTAYLKLFVGVVGGFAPILFLAGVPSETEVRDYPPVLRKLIPFAFIPLIIAYMVILYLYGIKIGAAMSWPRGGVALPVLVLSCVGFLGALLLHPLRDGERGELWAARYFRWFFPVLAPLAVLLLASVGVRVLEYGVTEERYLGIVAGIWILAGSLVFTLKRSAGVRWIPASLAMLCLLAALGPWSATAVSLRSQIARLDALQKKPDCLRMAALSQQRRNWTPRITIRFSP